MVEARVIRPCSSGAGVTTETTRYGFIYGPAHVERMCDGERLGVYIAIVTEYETMEIRVTPKGKHISVYDHRKNITDAQARALEREEEPKE